MPIAELILDSSSTDFESFYFKATDQHTQCRVLVASRDQFKRLLAEADNAPGLYILQAEDSTVYVGQSVDLQGRLKNHQSNNKIGYRKVMVLLRDQGLARYLDYGEAKLYQTLKSVGFRLEQSDLSGSLAVKQRRLEAMDRQHVTTADGLIKLFLEYSVALGLSKPLAPALPVLPPVPPSLPPPSPPSRKKLEVTLDTGVRFTGEVVAEVFVNVLHAAGLAEVAALGLVLSGEPLVATTRSRKYPSQSHEIEGWFVLTHCSTESKIRMLSRVAQGLGRTWEVGYAA